MKKKIPAATRAAATKTEIISRLEWIARASCEVNPSGTICTPSLNAGVVGAAVAYSSIDMCLHWCYLDVSFSFSLLNSLCISYVCFFFSLPLFHTSYCYNYKCSLLVADTAMRASEQASSVLVGVGISFTLIIYMRWDVTVIFSPCTSTRPRVSINRKRRQPTSRSSSSSGKK